MINLDMKLFTKILFIFGLLFVFSQSVFALDSTSLRSDGTILLNGQPFFPFGFTHETDSGRDGTCFLSDINLLGDAGFNYIHISTPADFNDTGFRGCGPKSMPDTIFTTAKERGVYIVAHYVWEQVSARVADLKNKPAVIGWSVGDDINNINPTIIAQRDNFYKETLNETSRLTFGPMATHPPINDVSSYYDKVDVILVESYPVGNLTDNGFNNELEMNMAYYAFTKDELKQGSKTTFLALPQTFAWSNNKRYPTPQELRNMTYAAFIYGAKGAVGYGFLVYPNPILPTDSPATWEEMKKMQKDLFEKSELTEVFMNGSLYTNSAGRTWFEPTGYNYLSGKSTGAGVFAGVWDYKNDTYAIVISTHKTGSHNTSIPLPAQVKSAINTQAKTLTNVFANDTRYGSGMTYNSANGNLEGSVASQSIHVYKFAGPETTPTPPPTPDPSWLDLVPANLRNFIELLYLWVYFFKRPTDLEYLLREIFG